MRNKSKWLVRMITVCLIFSMIFPVSAQAAAVESVDHKAVYQKQNRKGTCTLSSTAMMLRRAALYEGFDQWKNIKEFSMEHQTMIFMTGTSDYVIDGNAEIAEITDEAEAEQSDTMMTSITGSGCMLSALTGAFLAIDNSRDTLIKISQIYRECGETATKKARKLCAGSMTFRNMLIDEISNL